MKKSRIILSAIAAAAMIASVTSCGKKEEAKKLVIWSFTDELQSMVDN